MISSRVTVMGSLCSVEGTQRPSPGPPNWWTCNLNLRTGRASSPYERDEADALEVLDEEAGVAVHPVVVDRSEGAASDHGERRAQIVGERSPVADGQQ